MLNISNQKYTWLLKLSNEFLKSYKDKIRREKFEDKIKHYDYDLGDEFDPKDPNINVDDRVVLLNNDIVPVEPGTPDLPDVFPSKENYYAHEYGHHTQLLGKGGFARVVRVIWKGKPAVAKITVGKNDSSKMLNLANLKDKIPNEFKKHIPIVYDHFFDEKSK